MNKELLNAIAYLSKEKGVSSDVICDSLEAVLITAYKKEPDANPTAEVTLDRTTGDYQIRAAKTVVDDVEDEISKFLSIRHGSSIPAMKSATSSTSMSHRPTSAASPPRLPNKS